MPIEIGRVEAIFRYPVKSMGGERLDVAQLGWHGLDGDRRLAFWRVDDRGGFPWLTAGKLPDLLLFAPHRSEVDSPADLPTSIRTPDGKDFPSPPTPVREIGRLTGLSPDVRRFRPNLVVRSRRSVAFQEDEWVGGVLTFGEGPDAPAITVTMRDVRCAMLNLDPDSAKPALEMMKAVVRANQNNAGIYGAVTRQLAVGQTIFFPPPG